MGSLLIKSICGYDSITVSNEEKWTFNQKCKTCGKCLKTIYINKSFSKFPGSRKDFDKLVESIVNMKEIRELSVAFQIRKLEDENKDDMFDIYDVECSKCKGCTQTDNTD